MMVVDKGMLLEKKNTTENLIVPVPSNSVSCQEAFKSEKIFETMQNPNQWPTPC